MADGPLRLVRSILSAPTARARKWALRRLDPLFGRRSEDSDFLHDDIVSQVRPYTMTSRARLMALTDAVEYVVRAGVPGALVECGVWRGGSMMTMALMLKRLGATDRQLWLYDTFEGMTKPSGIDVSVDGKSAAEIFSARQRGPDSSDWCLAGYEDVLRNLTSTAYPVEQMVFVKGRVEESIPARVPPSIALLRLDTDWYSSTRHEMEHLYPLLAPGGVLILDDYGHWQGARRAVDEYFAQLGSFPLLHRIDQSGRMAVKPTLSTSTSTSGG